MKLKILIFIIMTAQSFLFGQSSWIRINQLGYLNRSVKVAVFVSQRDLKIYEFKVVNTLDNKVEWTSQDVEAYGNFAAFKNTYRLNFSEFQKSGEYFIEAEGIKSPKFKINNDVYDGTADFLLNYMRQQRCGYNPFLKDSCHTHDGFLVDDPQNDSALVDVKGGWHDASDYLQYLTTSANATYQMMFAYQKNPKIFNDNFDKEGHPISNGIPDILDEAKWGLDWLVKMNPENGVMYNQIADDRDHTLYSLPNLDTVNYGKGKERPVYYVTGKKQGLAKYKNRTTGVSSTAGKFASAFALGSDVIKDYYPKFADLLQTKSIDAYQFGKSDLGVTQTASNRSPYFYEEDNYVDDLELAAVQLYETTGNREYLKEAVEWGSVEPITPWMGLDTARHYQWYPFVNLGHYLLASQSEVETSKLFKFYLEKGLNKIYSRGKNNAFNFGVPFIWCSNNLVSAALTQARLYSELTGSNHHEEMEAALRDWLFGCNPWGTSMIVELPKTGDYPEDPHSAFWVKNKYQTRGGLVDGPVYTSIFNRLRGLTLYREDEYAQFQSDLVVYHDDNGDYSTNEPTMDGTASLTFYLSSMEMKGRESVSNLNSSDMNHGAKIRGDKNKKEIFLMFSGHDFNDGNDIIFDVLSKNKIKANFFFTGDFYRDDANKIFIKNLAEDGHCLGAHSDKHLLYASWEDQNELLISKEEFLSDLQNNYAEMKKFGIKKNDAPFFLPPYEWYNNKIANWTEEAGLKLISFSPGTRSNADYTFPSLGKSYVPSRKIYDSILSFENISEYGLNGFYLLLHVGAHKERSDKFYFLLDDLLNELGGRGYKFRLLSKEEN